MGFITRLNQELQGQPDAVLTGIMVGLGVALIIAAATLPPAAKVTVIAWVALP